MLFAAAAWVVLPLEFLSQKWDIELWPARWRKGKGRSTGWARPRRTSHAFQKKSPKGIKTAQVDIDLVERRLKTAQRDYEARYGKAKR